MVQSGKILLCRGFETKANCKTGPHANSTGAAGAGGAMKLLNNTKQM